MKVIREIIGDTQLNYMKIKLCVPSFPNVTELSPTKDRVSVRFC